MEATKLKPSLGLSSAIFYGLGTILGAGIYVLVGKIAGIAGMFAPIAFIVAAILATFSALSYAELSSRYPKSAGAALYVHKAFGNVNLSRVTGILIFFSGLISAGVLANGFAGYLGVFVDIPLWIGALGILALLTAVALIGIELSSYLVSIITLLEVGGLLFIIWVARAGFADLPARLPEMIPSFDLSVVSMIILGAFLAFYAFVGFEDLANTAEELRNPKKDMPKAIIIIMILSTVLYLLVALVAVLGLPLDALQSTEKPLALLYEQTTGNSPILISVISLFSVMNGILVQVIMASRLMYGMSDNGWLPKVFAYVHPKTKTPIISTLIVFGVMVAFTLLLEAVTLANLTSFVILTIFCLVNGGLWWIKYKERKQGTQEPSHYTVSAWIPAIGLLINMFFIVFKLISIF